MQTKDARVVDVRSDGPAVPHPFVTIIVPLLNGASYLAGCLDHIAALDYPRRDLEVLVVDGQSSDDGPLLASRLLRSHGLVGSVISNPGRSISSNLNVGLGHARGSVICRVDVKSRIPSNYLRDATALLAESDTTVWVGGGIVAVATAPTAIGRGIARAHNNPIVMGGAGYRLRRASGGAETVYLGTGRAETLREIGGWGTDLAMNEDYDLCQRLGGVSSVWFDDRLTAQWLAPASATSLISRYQGFGRSKVTYWRSRGTKPAARQTALLVTPALAAGIAALLTRRHSATAVVRAGALVGISALLGIDAAFGPDENTSLRERSAAALVAAPLIGGGWLSGVVLEIFNRPPAKPVEQPALVARP